MRNRSLAKRYATALLELAVEKNQIDQVEKDLVLVSNTIKDNDSLAEVISGQFATDVKRRVLSEVFASRIQPLTLKFLQFVLEKHREDELETIIEVFREQVRLWQGIVEVEVLSSVELDASDLSVLQRKLESFTGKNVILNVQVVPELIGGLRIRIGDLVIDGSLATRLKLAAEQLVHQSYHSLKEMR